MSQPLSLPRKIALLLLCCVAALTLVTVWQFVRFPPDFSDFKLTRGQSVLLVGMVAGLALGGGLALRMRRQLRTRSRYLLWTAACVYFFAGTLLALVFGRWTVSSVAIGVGCIVAFGIALWGATAERQRTIEYTLFPRAPRKAGPGRKAPVAKQGV